MHTSFRAFVVALLLLPFPAGATTVTYWNVFNIEGESAITADIVTYGTLLDMLTDANRLGVFQPQGGGAGQNVVGSGSDGTIYWNVFNIESERAISADIVTYGSLPDMLTDANRLGVFQPQGGGAAQNVVGSGSDGTIYWNVFNIESERAISADIVTYGALLDMLTDANRLGVFQPQGGGAAQNVVGSGASLARVAPPPPTVIPLPAAGWLILSALGMLCTLLLGRGRRDRHGAHGA